MHPTRTRILQLSVTITVGAFAACGGDGAEPTAVGEATTSLQRSSTAATSTPPSQPESKPSVDQVTVLPFVDEFDIDGNSWGGPFQRFEDGAYVWDLPSGQSDARAADTLIDIEDEIDDVVVTVAFTAVGVDAVGIQCAYEELDVSSRWYELELGTAGTVIRRRPIGSAPIEQLAADDTITLTAQPTELVAECWHDTDGYRL